MPKHRVSKRSHGFQTCCACKLHVGSNSDRVFHVYSSTPLLKKSSRDFLEASNNISSSRKHICDQCILLTLKLEQENIKEREELQKLESVGTSIANIINADIKDLTKESSLTLDNLSNYNASLWIKDRPQKLVALLKSICELGPEENDKNSYLLAKVIEQLYYIKHPKLNLPLSQRESILCYSLTSSKIFSNFQAHTSPSSSYWNLIRTLDQAASTPITFPSGTVRYAFDNNQVIGKTYLIRGGDHKVPSSVITSSSYTQIDEEKIQYDVNLKPANWMFQEPTDEQREKIVALTNAYDSYFRESRNEFISQVIESLKEECLEESDYIDKLVTEQQDSENYKLCTSCGGENDVSFRVCRNCNGPLVKTTPNIPSDGKNFDPYKSFEGVNINDSKATVIPGEPDFINPNSYETLVTLLRNVGERAGIDEYGGERKWLMVECDGLPYSIVRNIIDNVYKCPDCKLSFYGLDAFAKHFCCLIKTPVSYREFAWVVPIIGLFHLELNTARSFVKLNWNIFLSDIAFVLGFKSDKAQKYCEKGSDHHKTWNLLEIVYGACSMELLLPYMQQCNRTKNNPTVEGYWEWCDGVNSSNYRYMQQMTFTFLHALMMFRTGVRRNNVQAINAGRNKFIPLFYAQHHPRYQQIIFRDMVDDVLMPAELKAVMDSCMSMSRTKHSGHNQGGDGCLEEINKDSKSWLKVPGGVPDEERWLRIFRNLTQLKEIRDSTLSDVGIEDTSFSQRSHDIQREVQITRVAIRRAGYLSNPQEARPMSSLGGRHEIDEDMVDFTFRSREMTSDYFTTNLHGKGSMMDRVCVTRKEKETQARTKTMTCEELRELIKSELVKLPPQQATGFTATYMKLCTEGSKKEHMTLYYDILEELETYVPDAST